MLEHKTNESADFFIRRRVESQCVQTLLLKKAVDVKAEPVEAAMDANLQLEKGRKKIPPQRRRNDPEG